MSAAALVNTFFGLHPRNAQVPPNSRDSTTATFQPCLAQVVATVDAAGPVPTLIKSNLRGISRLNGCDTLAQARRYGVRPPTWAWPALPNYPRMGGRAATGCARPTQFSSRSTGTDR